tara:strand:+ start:417 stop:833 length:417 start_codon:yes stop_codon:yes gene_type:complete
MIKYSLICNEEHSFEAWFLDSKTCDKQIKKSKVECPLCGSVKIEKNIMAPNIPNKSNQKKINNDVKKVEMAMTKIKKHVEDNYEYVGEKFPDEARAMHYEEKESKDIYGETSIEEAKDLIEEGINVQPLPGINPKSKN